MLSEQFLGNRWELAQHLNGSWPSMLRGNCTGAYQLCTPLRQAPTGQPILPNLPSSEQPLEKEELSTALHELAWPRCTSRKHEHEFCSVSDSKHGSLTWKGRWAVLHAPAQCCRSHTPSPLVLGGCAPTAGLQQVWWNRRCLEDGQTHTEFIKMPHLYCSRGLKVLRISRSRFQRTAAL